MVIWDDRDTIATAVATASNYTEAIVLLGMNPKGSVTRRKLNQAIAKHTISTKHFNSGTWSNADTIRCVVANSLSITDMLERLQLQPRSGNYTTATKYIQRYNIDTNHFNPVLSGQIKKRKTAHEVIPLIDILDGLYPTYKTYTLKKRMIDAGYLIDQCSECGLRDWNGKPITLDLDHINGIYNDHVRSNLRLLCPNCHSQTDTYKGRNKKQKNKGTITEMV